MTIEQLIVQCLYENKSVTLQSIGVFTLSPDVLLDADSEKEVELPEGSILFEADIKAVQDPGLIEFITRHTRKMKSLAVSDLESYIMLQKQFLNIGKPLIIPGMGSLQKNQQGEYVFSQGKSISKHLEKISDQKESASTENISFKTEQKSKKKSSSNIIVLSIILVVVLGGAATYYFLTRDNSSVSQSPLGNISGTTITPPILTDSNSVSNIPDSLVTKDSSLYKVVIRQYNNLADANQAATILKSYGHKIESIQRDSLYLLAISIYRNGGDSARIRDSLQRFFNFKTYILR